MNRRTFLKVSGLIAAAAFVGLAPDKWNETEIVVDPHGASFRQSDIATIHHHSGMRELILIDRVWTDSDGRTVFDVTRNI